MLTEIFNKYMNIFIIILYVYILYSYDFKDNIQLLLVVTGIFIYIIYNNKNNIFTKDIIEGNTDETPATEPATGSTTRSDLNLDTSGLQIVDGASIERIRELLQELESETGSITGGGEGGGGGINNIKLNELLDLYLQIDPNLDLSNIGNLGEIKIPDVDMSGIDMSGINIDPSKFNINIGDIKIPDNLIKDYNANELPALKQRIFELEKKIKELDEEENVNIIKERIMDLELEANKWEEGGDEEDGGDTTGESLEKRKVRSFSNYKTTTPMGMYDGLCLDHLEKENTHSLADEKDVNTFLGTTLPLKVKKADNSKLTGPSVDGNDDSPKRLNMFETNKTSISCCEESSYLSSNGCVCLTSDQKDYLINRGGNHEV